eukprot:g629.t1
MSMTNLETAPILTEDAVRAGLEAGRRERAQAFRAALDGAARSMRRWVTEGVSLHRHDAPRFGLIGRPAPCAQA